MLIHHPTAPGLGRFHEARHPRHPLPRPPLPDIRRAHKAAAPVRRLEGDPSRRLRVLVRREPVCKRPAPAAYEVVLVALHQARLHRWLVPAWPRRELPSLTCCSGSRPSATSYLSRRRTRPTSPRCSRPRHH
eukprot:6167105-Prymnesium_polylepis.1